MRPYVQGTDASALLGVRLESDKTAGRIYAAYPNLANVRWLLPAKEPALRRAAIEGLYQPSSLRGRALRTIIGAGALQGEKVWLEEDNLQRLETMVASAMGVDAVRLAFYLGVPAPHRKVTAQVLTPEGKTLAYAKITTRESLIWGRMEAYLWGRARLFGLFLAHISHSDKPALARLS